MDLWEFEYGYILLFPSNGTEGAASPIAPMSDSCVVILRLPLDKVVTGSSGVFNVFVPEVCWKGSICTVIGSSKDMYIWFFFTNKLFFWKLYLVQKSLFTCCFWMFLIKHCVCDVVLMSLYNGKTTLLQATFQDVFNSLGYLIIHCACRRCYEILCLKVCQNPSLVQSINLVFPNMEHLPINDVPAPRRRPKAPVYATKKAKVQKGWDPFPLRNIRFWRCFEVPCYWSNYSDLTWPHPK